MSRAGADYITEAANAEVSPILLVKCDIPLSMIHRQRSACI